MTTPNQRWRDRRDSYRPAEPVNPHDYDVVSIPDDTTAKTFVEQHHYSGSFPNARFRYGLFHKTLGLAGVAVFGTSFPKILTDVFPGPLADSVELSRFVLLDYVPGNGESWFIARCFEQLRKEQLRGVLSFSDPLPRTDVAGRVIHAGHIGTIYQATNGVYIGRGAKNTLKLLPDGTVFSRRAEQKIRSGEKGWRYAVKMLEKHGAAPCPADASQRVAWMHRSLAAISRPLRHPGNHKYAWTLQRKVTMIGTPQAYPKTSPLFAASR